MKLLNLISNNFKILQKISKLLFSSLDSTYSIPQFFKIVNSMIKHHGLKFTVKSLKQMRLHITRYMCGDPLLVNDLKIGITKDGWPKRLLFLKETFDSSKMGKRFVMTLMMLSRSFTIEHLKEKPTFTREDLKSIWGPKTNLSEYTIPNGFIQDFKKKLGLSRIDLSFSREDCYFSNKASINGPATRTASDSIKNLSMSQIQNIWGLTDTKGRDYFNKFLEISFNDSNWNAPAKCGSHRVGTSGKLSFLADPELKVRVIAIFDYMSQLYLKKIHDGLLLNLRKINTDRTFTQDPYFEINKEHKLWSMDLSSATDRFPVKLQKRLLSELIGSEQASHWESLLVSRDFQWGVDPDVGPQTVKYTVGQPMGAYSSWAAFTLTHHLVVHWCCYLAKVQPNCYIILGDDIVINNDLVAYYYRKMMKRLGVELSLAKTHVSCNTYEFAKRWINIDEKCELTGLPMAGIYRNIDNPVIVYTILFDYFFLKRNYYSYNKSLVYCVLDLYENLILTKLTYKKVKDKLLKRPKSVFSGLRSYRINVRKFLKSLELHSFSLKYTFNLLTEQEKRSFLASKLRTEAYNFLGEWDHIAMMLSFGMINLVTDSFQKIKTLSLRTRFELKMDGDDFKEMRHLPLFSAIINHIERIKEVTVSGLESGNSFFETAKGLVILDFDKITSFEKDANKISTLMKVGEAFKRGFNLVNSFEGEGHHGSTFYSPDKRLMKSYKPLNALIYQAIFDRRLPDIFNPWDVYSLGIYQDDLLKALDLELKKMYDVQHPQGNPELTSQEKWGIRYMVFGD